MKRALIIRHHEAETMGTNFRAILERHGFEFVACNIFESAPGHDRFDPPPPDEVDLIMAFGGPMSVNDDMSALHREREYMRDAMALGKPLFGVCLGAQMMATALGGTVESSGGYQFGAAQDSHNCRRRRRPGFRRNHHPAGAHSARRVLHHPRGSS